jgi:hypothetical protein
VDRRRCLDAQRLQGGFECRGQFSAHAHRGRSGRSVDGW